MVAAVVLTVTTEVPVPLGIEAGLREHVGGRDTAGVMLHVRFTVLLKPFTGATVIVDVADPPAETVAGVSAEAAMVKSATGAAVSVKLMVVLWFAEPAPATVTMYAPVGVVAEVLIVSVEVPEPPEMDAGTKAHVGAGVTTGVMLLHDRFTVPVKPLSGARGVYYRTGSSSNRHRGGPHGC